MTVLKMLTFLMALFAIGFISQPFLYFIYTIVGMVVIVAAGLTLSSSEAVTEIKKNNKIMKAIIENK